LLSALRGDGGVVIVGGEAGMGKTRLVAALSARARRLGCAVISGGCSEAEISLPYLPFLEAVGNYLATADVAALRERLGPAAEELAQLFPQLGRPASSTGDASAAKMRLFESMLMLLRDAAGKRALLVILEDLQWADPATRELLDYATRRLRSTNVLVVATYRTDEMHRKHALLPTIQGWRRNGQVVMLDLDALSSAQVGEVVSAIFEQPTISDEFRDLLRERSEGNPFVLEEMLRDALDRGDIYRGETGWDRKPLAEMRLPPTVRDTILQRLERLSRAEVAVLAAASVIGRSFDVALLAEVAGVDESVALLALEASVSAQLVEQEDRTSGRYRFRHALTREAIYEDLVVPRRQQLHSRVADVLQAAPEHVAADIANHLLMARRNDEAVAMCEAAADDALRTLAFRGAAELLERAAPLVTDSVRRARLLCRAGDCYWNNTESGNAKRALEQGVADLEDAGLEQEAAVHRLLLGRCYWELMRSDLAKAEYEHAQAVLEPYGPSEALALAYMRLGGLAAFDEDHVTGLDYATRAVDIATQAGAEIVRVWALGFVGVSEVALGRVEEGFGHLEQSYDAAVAGGYRFQVTNAVYNAVFTARDQGLGTRLAAWSERVSTKWTSESDAWVPYVLATVELERGELGKATTDLRLALGRARESGHQKMVWRTSVMLAQVLAESLLPDESAAVLPPISTRAERQDMADDIKARLRVHMAAGDRAGALDAAKLVDPGACSEGRSVAAVAEVVDDATWLRRFIDTTAVRGEGLESPYMFAARGRLALLEGDHQEARELLGRAEGDHRDGGLKLEAWHCGRALAEAEFRSGDVTAARGRLIAIVAEAEPAGAHLAARLVRDTAEALGLDVAVEAAPRVDGAKAARVVVGERMVSVLFADVRGYSELTASTDPAQLADRIATLQRWAAQEVARRHGIVDKFAGDAVMATFNVAGQSVDHCVQALRAGLAIIDKAALAGLPVGAAVAVGPAVVGSLAESANVSVLGDVTNLASRLQAKAGAGEVMLTEEAHRRVREWLESQNLHSDRVDLELRGFDQPVIAYRLKAGLAASV